MQPGNSPSTRDGISQEWILSAPLNNEFNKTDKILETSNSDLILKAPTLSNAPTAPTVKRNPLRSVRQKTDKAINECDAGPSSQPSRSARGRKQVRKSGRRTSGSGRLSRTEVEAMMAAGAIKTEDGYGCPLLCGTLCKKEIDVMRHTRWTCGENNYRELPRCPKCGATFSRPCAVRRHLRTVHDLTMEQA